MSLYKRLNLSIVIIILLLNFTHLWSIENKNRITIGEIKQIESKILGEKRDIYVYTPDDYANSNEQYPVLFVLDGNSSFHHVSGIVQYLSSSELIPNLIVIAIPNTNRRRDLLPEIESADKFLEFISDELIPTIDLQYRTVPYRTLAGHSWGAIFTIYSFIKSPELFNAYIASSPWLNNRMRFICDEASQFVKEYSSLNRFVYLTVGDEPSFIPGIEILSKIFDENPIENLDWNFQHRSGEYHNSITHNTIYQGLLKLFSDWRIPENINIELLHISLQNKYGYSIRTYEDILLIVGQRFFDNENYDNALEIYKKYITTFPDSTKGYKNLGEVYLKIGEKKTAIDNFQKAIKLNPDDENIRKRLNEIEEN